jgi:NADH dehydrogenase (ubiquinone) 1 alpha subcomplex subunit 6
MSQFFKTASAAKALFVPKTKSLDLAAASKQAISLYRYCLRTAPLIREMYGLDLPVYQMRQRVRQEFEKTKHVSDKNIIDMLVFKKATDLNECLQMFKTKHHVEQGKILKEFPLRNISLTSCYW